MTTSTRDALLTATLRVLTEQGIAKASARSIATEAGVNQALVFYHFGTIDQLLAAACEHAARERVAANREVLDAVTTLPQLVAAARQIHAREQQAGHVAGLGQLLAGSQSHAALAEATGAALQLWVREVDAVLRRVLSTGVLAEVVDIEGLAQVVSASFVGLELYEGVDPAGADRAFGALESLADVVAIVAELGPLETRAVRHRVRRATQR